MTYSLGFGLNLPVSFTEVFTYMVEEAAYGSLSLLRVMTAVSSSFAVSDSSHPPSVGVPLRVRDINGNFDYRFF